MSTSLIFVDSRLSLRADVLKNLPTDSRIITLNSTTDGLQQMADAVSAYQNLDSIHVISHGSAGALYLGNSVLNAQTLPNYSSALSALGNSLSSTGDILLYGCNVAEGETGAAFINQLAQATGADVAASTNLTGQGGDWALEAQTGSLETAALNAEGWQGQLAAERDFTVLTQGTGIVTTDVVSGEDDHGRSLAVQADGKILLGGSSADDYWSRDKTNFAVVRYNADGTLDTNFSDDGKLTTDLSGYTFGESLTVQADGKILLGGTSWSDFAVVRYNPDGSLDTSFSDDGKLTTDFGSTDEGHSLTVQADGKILVGGYTYTSAGGRYDFALVRYNPDGNLDTSFSGDGKLTTDLGGSDWGESLTVQADGKILLGGTSWSDSAVVRYNPDGSLDTSFGGDGIVTTSMSGDGDRRLTVQADGKILLGGYSGGDFAVVRYNPDGSLDTSFSDDGKLTTDLGGDDHGYSLTVQADGKILLGGYSYYDRNYLDFALVRYNPDGSLDTSFGGDGIVITTDTGVGESLTVQADGKILLGGYAGGGFSVVRYNPDGSLDTSFSSNHTPTGSLAISGTLTQGQTLTVNNAVVDSDGLGQFSYQWLANGVAVQGATGSSFTPTQAQVGKAISVKASYFDGAGTKETLLSNATAPVENANLRPTGNVGVAGAVIQGQTLTATHTLRDEDGLGAMSYQWLADGVAVQGATDTSFTLTQAQVGKAISVVASYTDAEGTAERVTSNVTSAVVNINDAPTGSLTVTGTAQQNQTLTATNTLADADGLGAVSYQWLADGRAISGATASTLTLGQALVGKAISVKASYTDGFNYAETVTSAATSAVLNVNDAPSGSVTVSGTVAYLQTLTANHTLSDVDGMGTVRYQWLVDGVAVQNATNKTFAVNSAAWIGKTVAVDVSYTDRQGTAERVSSALTSPVAALQAGVLFSNASNLVTTEAGGQASVGVTLRAAPTQDVTLTFTLSDASEGAFVASGSATTTLTFSATNWFVPQTLAVAGVDDKPFDPDVRYTLSTKAASADAAYNGMQSGRGQPIATLTLTNQDNDEPDEVYGDAGGTRILNEELRGGNGASDLYGLNGRDTIYGGNGDDRLFGDNGDDVLYGENDNDELEGGAGNDKLYGNTDNDKLTGGTGRDSLYGGDGNDVLDGSSDSDYMDGGNGADIYYIDNVLDTIRDSGTDGASDTVFVSINFPKGYVLGAGIDNATLDALASNSALTGNAGQNELTGNNSDNSLNGDAGNDTLNGGGGKDSLSGGVGSDTLNGGIGDDTLNGGTGDDVYVVDSVGDVVTESANAGSADTVQASVSYVLSTNVEKLVLSGREAIDGTGNRTDNTLIGNASKNQISGQAGNDILDAGGGNDTLIGGVGNDILTGGLGKDTFKLDALNESGLTAETRDVINDFRIGEDKVGLAGIDANANKTGDQAFTTFILSSKTFTAAGQLQFKNGVLYGNTDNDADAEFSIALTGISTLAMSDIVA